MKGLKVKCPNCTRVCFETTDQFNPDAPPHGGMVKCLLQYHIDWLCSPTTVASEMCCPECLAPLVVGGVLNVVMPARETGEAFKVTTNELQVPVRDDTPQAHMDGEKLNIVDPKNFKFICDVCGKECKNQFGLNSHKKSHKGGN